MSDYLIRPVTEKDAPELLEIYSYYILNTAITFEWDVPSLDEWINRIKSITSKHPYLVCEKDGVIIGYAYAHNFNERKAYDWTLETSIYIHKDFRRSGAGKKLYAELENRCRNIGIKNFLTKICYAETEDEYITHDSVNFHKKMGYETVGHLKQVGLKFNKWYDIIMMEKFL